MPLPGAYFGAFVGFMVGVLLQGSIFGYTSKAGYHGRNGQFKSKGDGMMDKALFIFATTVAGYITGGTLLALFLANPVIGILILGGILYIGLHQDIDNWNLI